MSESKAKGASSIIKDALALCAITLVAAVLLGFVNEVTKDLRAEQQAKTKAAAYREVFAQADHFIFAGEEGAEDLNEKFAEAAAILEKNGYSSAVLDETGLAKDAAGATLGYVMTITAKGYSKFTMTMGYSLNGEVTGIAFITLAETPGLGMNADEAAFKSQFAGKTADVLTVTKTGASAENEINAISSATITSNGVTGAVNAGISFAKELIAGGIGGGQNE